MNKKTIFFDFDGVIVNSFDVALSVNQISKPTLTEDRYRQMFNGNINDAVHIDPVVKEIDFQKEYAEKFKELPAEEGIKTILQALSKDFQMFIVSSTVSKTIEEYLERHDMLGCFTKVLGSDIEESKVKKFNMIFSQYSIKPEETIFISDTSGDIEEAQEAEIGYIVGILGGYQSKESLSKASPDAIVSDFQEFYQLVSNLNS